MKRLWIPAVLVLAVASIIGSAVLFLSRPKTIHEAAMRGNIGAVREMIRATPDLLNSRDNNGHTPLSLAILEGHFELVKVLVDEGAEINPKNSQQWAPLLSAACRFDDCSDKSLKLLIDKGADVNFRYAPEGWTALHLAVSDGMERKVKLLLESGANPNGLDKQGETPLDNALWVLQYLHGRSPHPERASWGDPVAHQRHIEEQERIVELLKKHGGKSAKNSAVPPPPPPTSKPPVGSP